MRKYNFLDLFIFFMSIMVVAIHIELMVESEHYLYSLIVRSAVPFYFMCVGYLLMNKVAKNKEDEKELIKKYKKNLYFIFNMVINLCSNYCLSFCL